MKIVLAAQPVTNRNTEANLRTILQAVHSFSGKADLILFGESFLQGFDALCWDYEKGTAIAVQPSDPVIARICQAARQARIGVSFGCFEKDSGLLHSSQFVIDASGKLIDIFHRVSPGWKPALNDPRYREGDRFHVFSYQDKRLTIALCGDLWTAGRPEEILSLQADAVLWPVWCDYAPEEWNAFVKHDYAQQAALCGCPVLLVNPFCTDADADDRATGGAALFCSGLICAELPAGTEGFLTVEI